MLGKAISLPVIDLTDFPSEREKLAAASIELGCFRVTNHGISAVLQAEMKCVVKTLFDMSAESKFRNADVIPGTGYMPRSAQNPLYESFGLYNAACSDDVRAFCSLMETSLSHK